MLFKVGGIVASRGSANDQELLSNLWLGQAYKYDSVEAAIAAIPSIVKEVNDFLDGNRDEDDKFHRWYIDHVGVSAVGDDTPVLYQIDFVGGGKQVITDNQQLLQKES